MQGESPGQPETSIRGNVAALDRAVDALRSGDSSGFDLLFGEFDDMLRTFLRQRAGDDADDIAQDVWSAVYDHATTLRLDGETDLHRVHQFRRYLLRCASNMAAKTGRDRLAEEDAIERLSAGMEESAPDIADAVALRLLVPERYEDLMGDRYDRKLTSPEIAAVRGKTPKAVRDALGRAHAAVRAAWNLTPSV